MSSPQGSPGESFLCRARPLLLARLASAALTFTIPLVLVRALSLEAYGTYKQLILIAQTLYYVLPFGVPQALYFFVPRSEERRPLYAHTLGFLLLSGGGVVLLVAVLGGDLARLFSNPALLEHRWSLALYVLGLMGSYPLEVSLTSRGRTQASAAVSLASDALRALAMVAPVVLGLGVGGVMTALAGFALLRMAVTWVALVGFSRGPLFDAQLLRRQLAYAAPFGAAVALAIPQQSAHQYAVSGIVSPELFALYAVACFQLPLVDLLYTPASEVLMVRLGELDRAGRLEQAAEAFRGVAATLGLVFLPLAVFLWAEAPRFISALFGARYVGAAPLYRLGLGALVLMVLPLEGVLRARGFTRHILHANLLKAALTVPLVWLGVTRLGMAGAMASYVLAECVGKAFLLWMLPAALSPPGAPLRLRDVLPLHCLLRAAACAVVAGLGVVAADASAERLGVFWVGGLWEDLMALGVSASVFASTYVVVLRLSGVRPWEAVAGLVGGPRAA